MNTTRVFRAITLTAFASTSSIALAAGFPGENPVHGKYFSRSGVKGSMCAPQGALKDLMGGKYKCYGPKGADACGASLDAAKGKLDPKTAELFVDLMKTDAALKSVGQENRDGHLYAAGCSDLGGADFIHLVSAGGLSYAKANPEAVLAQGTAANFSMWGAAEREAYVAALGRYGEAQKAKSIPILKIALGTKGSMLGFKKNSLKLLARFGSDEGVAYCLDVLKQGSDKDVGATCGYYLAERKQTDAAQILVRRLSDEEETFTRALGVMGAKDAVGVLKEEYEKRAGSVNAARVTVALLNLGDKSYDYAGDLTAMIQGKRPLSLRDRTRKAEELKAAKKGAADRWKTRENEVDENTARDASLESTYVVDAASAAKVTAALKLTAKHSEWPKASMMATSALAQRGDKAAALDLVKLLDSPKEEVRELTVKAFGSLYDEPMAFLNYAGRKGVVVEPTAVPALVKYIENEPKDERRVNGLRALGAVRSFLP